MNGELTITRDAMPYLIKQRGALDDMRGDTGAWAEKYAEMLESEFSMMLPYLPGECESILDVGGGMCGIDALLSDHYDYQPHVTVLDGVRDPPEMVNHDRTFSNFEVARDFLTSNGCSYTHIHALDPADLPASPPRYYDLIISVKSWCFHYGPDPYLDFIAKALSAKATLILDIRKDKLFDYLDSLKRHFNIMGCIFQGFKFHTYHLEAK